ncbi:MAG: MarR family transcriptional regulator [Ignavibacteriales bacterium]|nr:MarR family transcriptional regulator [Ignavibacteriales bacterium]
MLTNTVVAHKNFSNRNSETWNLDTSLGFLMNRTARGMKRALDAKLLEHELTATQYIVLIRMYEEDGISLTELVERLYLDNPTLTGIIDRMERDGLLQRQRDDDDRRVVNVYLTAKGKLLRSEIEHLAQETDEDIWKNFSEPEKKEMLNYIERLWNNLND